MKTKPDTNSLAYRWGLKSAPEESEAHTVPAEDNISTKRKLANMAFGVDPDRVKNAKEPQISKKSESRKKLERSLGIELSDPENDTAQRGGTLAQAFGNAAKQ